MASNPEALIRAKRDMDFLLEVLGTPKPGKHLICPLEGSNDSFSVFRGDDETCCFFCFSCKAKGTVVDALILMHKIRLPEALREIEEKFGGSTQYQAKAPAASEVKGKFRGYAPKIVPTLDMDRATPFTDQYHEFLLANQHFVKDHKRGLSEQVIRKHRIGYIHEQQIKLYPWQSKPYTIPAAWVLPVTNADGELHGIKLHTERPIVKPDGESFKGKCLWVPFGIEPKPDQEKGIKPAHAYYTFWPHPDTLDSDLDAEVNPQWWVARLKDGNLSRRWGQQLDWAKMEVGHAVSKVAYELDDDEIEQAWENAFKQLGDEIKREVCADENKAVDEDDEFHEWVFVHPGELKAMAWAAAGYMATGSTGGESWIPPPDQLEWVRGRKICLFVDDDTTRRDLHGKPVNAGATWAALMSDAIRRQGPADLMVASGGRTTPPVIEGEL